ncbi:PREDICTED: ankyrin repeat domain-containing protein 30A isoform X3 [Chinchilla lanigera]|uniref:ankyrin repeat domain-containing protein 30A isoform X3 n=1 Tax=Chinchilla lanigera TaxID=34839 RepID=UPI000697D128|nr:PREDICTED: ankyrin repeat domain-containing protein 30A isoform X3 [Chinchilla lanigera]
MKRIFGLSSKGQAPLSPSRPRRSSRGARCRVFDRSVRKLHKAASEGDVARVQHLLLLGKSSLNDRDEKRRTALHFACAYGHPGVVTLLVERKCDIDACDSDNNTALIKAVQCDQEKCVTLLLEHGANPNVANARGNTALHYAIYSENTSIAAKLLSHSANAEAKNKDGLTPLLLALRENRLQVAELLEKKKANNAVDKPGRQLFEYEEKRPKNSQNSHPVLGTEPRTSYVPVLGTEPGASCMPVDENSNDDSLTRFSSKPGPDDSWPTSDDDDYLFDNENVPKVNLTELWAAAQQSRKNQAKYGIGETGNRTLIDNSPSDNKNKDMVETFSKTSVNVQDFSQSSSSSPSSEAKEKATGPVIRKEENGAFVIENASQEQTHDNVTNVDGGQKNYKSDMMFALGLGEDDESPWDSESISENLPQKSVDHLSGAADEQGKHVGNRQVEESPERHLHLKPATEMKDPVLNEAVGGKDVQTLKSEFGKTTLIEEPDLQVTSKEEQKRLDGWENNQDQVEEKRKQMSNEMEVSENQYDATVANADNDSDGLMQQRKNGEAVSQRFPVKKNEEHDSSEPVLPLRKVKKNENEQWSSTESVTSPVFQPAGSLAGGLLQVKSGCKLHDRDEDEGRSTKKTSNEKNKVKKKKNTVDDLDDLSQSSETPSEDSELPYPKYENILLLFEQLRMECKDSISVLKIWDALHSYKTVIELKKDQDELLTGKIKKLENKLRELQKELTETKEVKSQLEHEKIQREREIGNLRFALKQEEEKRKNVDQFYEKIKEQLRKKEEQYCQEVEAKQQLEVSLRTLDLELKTVRKKLNQVLEEQNDTQRQLSREQNARMLQDRILANRLCEQKEIEMTQEKMSPEVSVSHEEDLLHKNHRLQEELAMIRLEIDAIKNLNQEKEKKYLEDIEIANKKNDDLQRTIKVNEETFTKTIFQYNGQLNILTVENTMLNSKLENEKQNRERLETEIESYRSRLAAAVHDYDESQTSKRELELAFQRARDEWFRLQDKMNSDISNLKDNNDILSHQLSKVEKKFNSLEIELHHTRDALREKTSGLEQVQRDLNQSQCQMKELKHMYQDEQGKVNKYVGKQESMLERLSQLQSENTLLRQQLDDAHNKADCKEKRVINIQDQFHEIVKTLQGESEKQSLMLEDRNKELLHECSHLKERLCQYEKEKGEREVVVRQLQQELADTLKKQSMSEASLEVSSRYRINLEDETQDLKKKLDQTRSQLEEAQDQHTEAVRHAEKMQERLQKLELENSRLKVKIKKQAGKTEHLQKNVLSTNLSENDKEQLKKLTELKQSLEYTLDEEKKKNNELKKELTGFKKLFKMTETKLNAEENGEFYFHGDLKSSEFEMDIPINMIIHKIDNLAAKLETTSSKCLHLDKNNQFLHQELLSLKNIQKKCETLEKNKRKLEQEVVNLKRYIEENVVEHGQLQQYKQEIEERARQDLVEKLKQVNLFLQTQAASQGHSEQLGESNNASMRSQMELRIKDLESELSKMKTQEDSNEIQLEKYKQLYIEEFKTRKSLSSKLNKANERLEEANTKLLVEKQQSRSLLSTVSTRPVLECPCVGNLHHSLALHRSFPPRENLVVHTLNPQPSNNSMESYLTKMRQELENSITRELREATAELEAFKVPPRGSAHKSSQDLISEASQEYKEILRRRYMI